MTEINTENVKVIPFTNSSREISPEFQEFHDKMNGRPCTDMYDFKYVSKEERESEEWALIINYNYNNGYL